jgi:hypothetical protein
MIQTAVLNESTGISDADIRTMLPAFSHQWNVDLQPLSGAGSCSSLAFCQVRGFR